jgi:hypothetical protein
MCERRGIGNARQVVDECFTIGRSQAVGLLHAWQSIDNLCRILQGWTSFPDIVSGFSGFFVLVLRAERRGSDAGPPRCVPPPRLRFVVANNVPLARTHELNIKISAPSSYGNETKRMKQLPELGQGLTSPALSLEHKIWSYVEYGVIRTTCVVMHAPSFYFFSPKAAILGSDQLVSPSDNLSQGLHRKAAAPRSSLAMCLGDAIDE